MSTETTSAEPKPEVAAPVEADRAAEEPPKLEERPQVEVVELDGLVLLKIIRHCKESLPSFVTGQLLGLDIGRALEVTNCFPFPSRDDAEYANEEDKDGAEYQVDMMRCLRNVNVDNNTVGWYQSTHLGSYITESCLEHQFHYQENIRNCIVLIFDPMQTTIGNLHLKAFRLTDEFMGLYRDKQFTLEACALRAARPPSRAVPRAEVRCAPRPARALS
jgi:translation initiation factor 3 subunit H